MQDLANLKEADTKYDIHPLLAERWSPRSFADTPVEPELVDQLFEAARWAPSCFNEQPWRFIYALKQDEEEFEKLAQVLNEFNRKWAAKAPMLILNIAKENFTRNDKPNRHALYDLGAAVSGLTLEATRNDLYVHQMAGILPDKAKDLFDIPDDFAVVSMAAVGYLGDAGNLPEDLRKQEQAERSRKNMEDLVFRNKFGDPA